jgi:hypothetical protein
MKAVFDWSKQNMISKDEEKRDAFMRTAYISIMSFPERAIEHELPKKVKLNALDNIIKYFEGLEEYEKCSDLLEIKRNIEDF